jgi:hypothetical protein
VESVIEAEVVLPEGLGDVAAGEVIVVRSKNVAGDLISHQSLVDVSAAAQRFFEETSPAYHKGLACWQFSGG